TCSLGSAAVDARACSPTPLLQRATLHGRPRRSLDRHLLTGEDRRVVRVSERVVRRGEDVAALVELRAALVSASIRSPCASPSPTRSTARVRSNEPSPTLPRGEGHLAQLAFSRSHRDRRNARRTQRARVAQIPRT